MVPFQPTQQEEYSQPDKEKEKDVKRRRNEREKEIRKKDDKAEQVKKKATPRPGIEPGFSAWQAEILTTILPRITDWKRLKISLYSSEHSAPTCLMHLAVQGVKCGSASYITILLLSSWWPSHVRNRYSWTLKQKVNEHTCSTTCDYFPLLTTLYFSAECTIVHVVSEPHTINSLPNACIVINTEPGSHYTCTQSLPL